jgi:hypothetical protein
MAGNRQFEFLNFDVASEVYADSAALTDVTTLAKVTLSGVGGVALDISTNRMVNVGIPTDPKDIASKQYVDDRMGAGFVVHAPVRLCSSSNISVSSAPALIDGIAAVSGNRVLLVGQNNFAENGVYLYNGSGAALTRAVDGTSQYLTPGSYFFVNEGTANPHTAWVVLNDVPINVGVDPILFDQFSGLGQVNAGAGLTKTGDTLDVGKGDGIAIAPSDISVDLDANPALALVGTSPNKKLAFLPDADRGLSKDGTGAFIKIPSTDPGLRFNAGSLDLKVDASGALELAAAGLKIKLADTNLGVTLGELRTLGVPLNFMIDGVAVGSSVTAANLTPLCNHSPIVSQHTHAAQQSVQDVVDPGYMAGLTITKGVGLYISANGTVSPGTCTTDIASRTVGIAYADALQNDPAQVMLEGILLGALGGAGIRDERYFLGSDGLPCLVTALPGGARVIQLGIARNANDLAVQIFDFGKKPNGTPGGGGGQQGPTAPTVGTINGVTIP